MFYRLLSLNLIFASGLIATSSTAAADVLDFKSRLTPQQIEKHFAEIKPKAIAESYKLQPEKFPVFSAVVSKVEANSQASKIGISSGCLVITRNGTPLVMSAIKNSSIAGPLTWIDLQGQYHINEIEGGKLGIWHDAHRNLTAWYLSHSNRDARWDNEVICAVMALSINSAAAESFWAMAFDKGYQADRFSNFCGIGIALTDNDAKRAEAFAEAFGPLKAPGIPEEDVPHWSYDWDKLSLLSGNPKWIDAAAKNHAVGPGKWEFDITEMTRAQMEIFEKLPADFPSPSVLLKSMKKHSFLSEAVTNASWKSPGNHMPTLLPKAIAASFNNLESFPEEIVQAPINKSRSIWFGPKAPAKNIELTIRFSITPQVPTPNQLPTSNPGVQISIANRSAADSGENHYPPERAEILSVKASVDIWQKENYLDWVIMIPTRNYGNDLKSHSSTYLSEFIPSADLSPPLIVNSKQTYTLQIIRINNQVEALLDGKRLALIQVPDGYDDSGVFIGVSGVIAKIDQLSANILE